MVDQAKEAAPLAKRRRVRKGTRSCWECKRRKIRCLFAAPDDVTCIGCYHRRAPCVSQEMSEDLSPASKGNRHLSDRIARIEDVMKDWLVARPHPPDHPPTRALPTPVEGSLGQPIPRSTSLLSPNSHDPYAHVSADSELTALNHLLAALPTPEDVQILLRESARPLLYVELTTMQPRSKLTQETLAAPPSPPVDFSGPSQHPVLLAKWMLLFAITLQSPCGDEVLGLSEPFSVLMQRLTTAATMWVTTRDEMQGTIEGLTCIMLEAIFETNAGNLRRAWAVYRRALTVAQLMGLHLSRRAPVPRINAKLDADPEYLWFRIVYMDRYLSLLLGFPQGTTDQSMGAPAVFQHEPPLGQFERHLTVLAGRIIERKQTSIAASADSTTTQAIDADLLMVSQTMPASFWRPVNFHHFTVGSPEALLDTVRLGAQVYYHGLLIHLHLPYMMREVSSHQHSPSINPQHEYSKSTCVNASREILTRFIAHRTFNPTSSCSRPVDFFALLAAMTLLLAHLDAHHHRGVTNPLAHQRLSDRATLDQTVERMDVIGHLSNDITSRQSAALIQRLLEIEADAAGGNRYTTQNVGMQGGGEDSSDPGAHEGREPGAEELRLHIPYLGVIRIARQGLILQEPWPDHGIYQNSSEAPSNGRQSASGRPDAQLPASVSRDDEASNLSHSTSCPDNAPLQPDMKFPALAAPTDHSRFNPTEDGVTRLCTANTNTPPPQALSAAPCLQATYPLPNGTSTATGSTVPEIRNSIEHQLQLSNTPSYIRFTNAPPAIVQQSNDHPIEIFGVKGARIFYDESIRDLIVKLIDPPHEVAHFAFTKELLDQTFSMSLKRELSLDGAARVTSGGVSKDFDASFVPRALSPGRSRRIKRL
ncbi:hypothetical protein BJX76DRAFT_362717 [Aspergillus varians]